MATGLYTIHKEMLSKPSLMKNAFLNVQTLILEKKGPLES